MNVGIIGQVDRNARDAMGRALSDGGATPYFWSCQEARVALQEELDELPRCLFINTDAPGVAKLVAWLRGNADLMMVPLIGIVKHPDQLAASRAMGMDDAIDVRQLANVTARIDNLRDLDPAKRPPANSGHAIVAHSDELRRRAIGRVLRLGGFEVSYAGTMTELVSRYSGAPSTSLIVAEKALPSENGAALTVVRERLGGDDTPMIVLDGASDSVAEDSDGPPSSTRQLAESAPADHLLFLANELLAGRRTEGRTSRRLLFETTCSFREPGDREHHFGFTCNISLGGMYIRTFDPPKMGSEVWVEMAPEGSRPMHLRGIVAWVRHPSRGPGIVPAGFAIRFERVDCPLRDLDAFDALYAQLFKRRVPSIPLRPHKTRTVIITKSTADAMTVRPALCGAAPVSSQVA